MEEKEGRKKRTQDQQVVQTLVDSMCSSADSPPA